MEKYNKTDTIFGKYNKTDQYLWEMLQEEVGEVHKKFIFFFFLNSVLLLKTAWLKW
jgi:hypothetical protein